MSTAHCTVQYVSVLRVPMSDGMDTEGLDLASITADEVTGDGPTGKMADAAVEWKMVGNL